MNKALRIIAIGFGASLTLFSTTVHASQETTPVPPTQLTALTLSGMATTIERGPAERCEPAFRSLDRQRFFAISLPVERTGITHTERGMEPLLALPAPSTCGSDPAKIRRRVDALGVGRHVEVKLERFKEIEGRIKEIRSDSFVLAPDDPLQSGPNKGKRTPIQIAFNEACNVKKDVPDSIKAVAITIPSILVFLLVITSVD